MRSLEEIRRDTVVAVFVGGCIQPQAEDIADLLAEVATLRGAIAAADARALAATDALGLPPAGCDTAEVLGHEVERLRGAVKDAYYEGAAEFQGCGCCGPDHGHDEGWAASNARAALPAAEGEK